MGRNSGLLCGLLVAVFAAGGVSAQCPQIGGNVEGLKAYPLPSDQYAVDYQIGDGAWTPATVYISYYGQTLGSPYRNVSGYTAGMTSMSFTSIPAYPAGPVNLRVRKISGTPFQPSDHVSVRPSAKSIGVTPPDSDGAVEISTSTEAGFQGEQFILWWKRDTDDAGIEGLAFFLNKAYAEPTEHVQLISSATDLKDSYPDDIHTLDFEGQVVIGTGNVIYTVPSGIKNVFLGPGAWVQGKLRFLKANGMTMIYGPGVLDGSLFDYTRRDCPLPDENGINALSSADPSGNLDKFIIDGIIISDTNHTATDPLNHSTLNNVKTISWNSNNDGLRLKDSTTATNVFVRSGDDSLMMWGSSVTVTNATVWQNYNGGVVNLGWLNNSAGDYNLLDGLYVVKTDWQTPAAIDWTALQRSAPGSTLDGQNNAVFVSLMTPTTKYGQKSPPVFENIYVEDAPQVLLSLKIIPPVNCAAAGTACNAATLKKKSRMSLNIDNLYAPLSIVENSIGFQKLPANYVAQDGKTIVNPIILWGKIDVNFTNMLVKFSDGMYLPLEGPDAPYRGNISTQGDNVNVKFKVDLP